MSKHEDKKSNNASKSLANKGLNKNKGYSSKNIGNKYRWNTAKKKD